ncbi:MAG: hypothetical protein IT379_36590 [Deltaproteobacteria bacterium]|nr:hypothetical protein [Deltaproteobacteria bacterium]
MRGRRGASFESAGLTFLVVAAIAFASIVITSAPARATPADAFGVGPRAQAMGNTGVASLDGTTAAFYNAAALAAAEHPSLLLSYNFGHLALELSGRDPNILDMRGFELSGVFPLRLARDWTLAVGGGLHLPDQFIARIQLLPATEPHFVMWDNRVHRIVVQLGASVRWRNLLAFGVGASLFADASGNGLQFRIDSLPGRTIADAALDVELPIRAAPIAGLLVSPRPWLRFGLRYRGELSLDLALDIVALARIPGTSIAGDVIISVRGTDYYTPAEVAGGAEVDVGPLTLAAELAWHRWSDLPIVASDVALLIRLGVEPSTVQAAFPDPTYDDILIPRLGASWRIDLPRRRTLMARAGWWYERSPVPDQTGITSFADNNRHVTTLGGALSFPDFGFPFTIEAAFQAHWMVERQTAKVERLSPVGDFVSSGQVYFVSLGLRAEIP